MTTMQDVARHAGTSAAVVSYVLNNGPRPVSAETREKVLRAVDELGYRINSAGRTLRSRKSKILGLIVPDSSHPFFADISRRIERSTYDLGYVVLIGNTLADPVREREYFELFREHQVDGVILTIDPEDRAATLIEAGIPVVLLDERSAELDAALSSVSVDNFQAAFDATTSLIAEGHSSIGFIGGNPGLPSADSRFEGWKAALDNAGMNADRSRRVEFSRQAGYEVAFEFLEDRENAPTAMFVSSDQQAVGLLRACGELGVAVPRELSVISFDDSDDALYTTPPLTTVRQPIDLLIDRALQILLDPPAQPVHERYPHEIVRRASTIHH
ncbi:LacI family DNA-binding transcriptional regulator [Salinibacterium sp. SWN1162]|uniref:LacI family DNA-binding transcriptional regulator n=1 Tax=Salinibacterium sp. SWN1162 TaxID=2792053 RepID=UPI0018CEBA0B|nr:LacI family DNA-binding transcriptional regulator [Salinibacterium sp. SWN1162]MBH0009954.1 LacI family DNA-binding transcriptional regulator [Salinibacterium sp. SWN1162]